MGGRVANAVGRERGVKGSAGANARGADHEVRLSAVARQNHGGISCRSMVRGNRFGSHDPVVNPMVTVCGCTPVVDAGGAVYGRGRHEILVLGVPKSCGAFNMVCARTVTAETGARPGCGHMILVVSNPFCSRVSFSALSRMDRA